MTLFSKKTISSQTPFLKMILYFMILIKKDKQQANFYFDTVENIHSKVENKLHLQQIKKTSSCIPKAN